MWLQRIKTIDLLIEWQCSGEKNDGDTIFFFCHDGVCRHSVSTKMAVFKGDCVGEYIFASIIYYVGSN